MGSKSSTPAVVATTPAATTPASGSIPAYTEDPTYHGHGGRVFVKEGVAVPSTWKLTTEVTAPAGEKAYFIPREVMETMYLQNLSIYNTVPQYGGPSYSSYSQLQDLGFSVSGSFGGFSGSVGKKQLQDLYSKTGFVGVVGVAGVPGVPGVEGVAGVAGVPGVPGVAGVQGVAGVPGLYIMQQLQ